MAKVEIDYDMCENSQVCEAVCPVEVFAVDQGIVRVINANECVVCMKCVESCCSGAIAIDF